MYKKISTKHLQPGMFIVDTGIPWLDNPYLYSAETEVSEELIQTILNDGFLEVYIDPNRGQLQIDYEEIEVIDEPAAPPADAPPDAPEAEAPPAATGYPMPDIPILAEMDAARNTYVCAMEQARPSWTASAATTTWICARPNHWLTTCSRAWAGTRTR